MVDEGFGGLVVKAEDCSREPCFLELCIALFKPLEEVTGFPGFDWFDSNVVGIVIIEEKQVFMAAC